MNATAPPLTVVIPAWNSRDWLPACLESLRTQTRPPDRVIVVDNDSLDGTAAYLRSEHPDVELIELADNTGFAHAANRGLSAAASEFVALINPDVVLAPDWLEQMTDELCAHPDAASVACKMVALEDPTTLDDAGDVLRRDGVCAQRGRFTPDDGRFDRPGEVFGACAGAALYRAPAVNAVGGFDERYFAYLEDVDLALRLALAGWRCRYRPAVARHASEGSARRRPGMREFLATRNTIYLMAKAFPLRWLHLVLYRQASWLWHAGRERRLRAHLRALVAALPMLGHAIAQRRGLRSAAAVPIEIVVPAGPIRGPAIP